MLKVYLSLIAVLISVSALAESAEKLDVSSDYYKMSKNKDGIIYNLEGNVHFKDHRAEITADKAIAYLNKKNEVIKIQFTGKPVHTIGLADKLKNLDSRSEQLIYSSEHQTLTFLTDVTIIRDGNTLTGPEFIYHIKTQLLDGGKQDGRFHFELQGQQ